MVSVIPFSHNYRLGSPPKFYRFSGLCGCCKELLNAAGSRSPFFGTKPQTLPSRNRKEGFRHEEL